MPMIKNDRRRTRFRSNTHFVTRVQPIVVGDFIKYIFYRLMYKSDTLVGYDPTFNALLSRRQ